MAKSKTHKVGRDAITGYFIPVEKARQRPSTSTVETVKNRIKKPK